MAAWRDPILAAFADVSPLTLAADPDGLLLEDETLAVLQGRGYVVVSATDPLAFRVVYERGTRAAWDAGEATAALVVRVASASVDSLPYDLLQRGRRVSLSLHSLLPDLSYPVVRDFAQAAPAMLDRLMHATAGHLGPRLGDEQTLAFIARHVYGLAPEMLATPDDLVEALLNVHYHAWPVPDGLRDWWLAEMARQGRLTDLPLADWLDRGPFFAFLEGQWQAHLSRQGYGVQDAPAAYAAAPRVDFGRPRVRVMVDSLFLERRLRPAHVIAERAPDDWQAVGVALDTAAYRDRRLAALLDHLDQAWPAADARPRAWLDLAPTWAAAVVLVEGGHLPAALADRYVARRDRLTADFAAWLSRRYGGLHSLNYHHGPVVGHQAAPYLALRRRQGVERVALLVVDGLALDQWAIVRDVWAARQPDWRPDEAALFAVLPTITPIARQALFAGSLPSAFADTWQRTDSDDRRWRAFWEREGLAGRAVTWRLGLDSLVETLADDRLRALGLVVSTVDEMLHGAVGGLADLHARVRRWAEDGALTTAVAALFAAGFTVWLTSDHGNVQAQGIGRPQEGVLVEQRGTRARFYTDRAFQQAAHAQVPNALPWTPDGLPPGVLTLFAPDRTAFATLGETLVSHGGLTLEEAIVPWITLTPGTEG